MIVTPYECARGSLQVPQLGFRVRALGVDKRGNHLYCRHQLVQQLKPLGLKLQVLGHYAGEVAAGPAQTRDETKLNRIDSDPKDNRNRGGCGVCSRGGRCASAAITLTWRRTRSAAIVGRRS